MKKLTLLFYLITINSIVLGQESIITGLDENNNLVGEKITDLENKSEVEIYKKTKEWIAFTFTNTESVMQSDIENKMLRLNGISKSVIGPYYGFYFDLSYQIQVEIKNEKIRFRIYNLKQVSQSSPYTSSNLELIYKKGELRKGKRYGKLKNQVDEKISSIYENLIDFIKKNKTTSKDDW